MDGSLNYPYYYYQFLKIQDLDQHASLLVRLFQGSVGNI